MPRSLQSRLGSMAVGFLVSFLSILPAIGQSLPVDSTRISDAAQDSTGTVWAIAVGSRDLLYRWEKDHWDSVALPGQTDDAWPAALSSGPRGAVLVLWTREPDWLLLSWHHGRESKVLAAFSGHLSQPRMFSDSSENVWVTETGPKIYRVTSGGDAQRLYSIAPEQYHSDGRPKDDKAQFNPLYATSDRRGRNWFWSETLAGASNIASLRGVLIFDGGGFVHRATLEGLPDKKLSVIEKKDEGRMWVAVEDDALYEVDITMLKATRVPEPAPRAFSYVQKIFKASDGWYVVAGPMWQTVPERAGEGRTSVLWRQRAGGWEKLVTGLDSRTEYAQHPLRPWFGTEDGLWLGAFGSGPWFIPQGNTQPIRLNWESGFQVNDTPRLFKLSDGRLLAVSFEDGSIAAEPRELLAGWRPSPRVQTFRAYPHMVQDARGTLWGVVSREEDALSEWDGEKWIDHRVPAGIHLDQLEALALDSHQRVWLLPDHNEGPAAIFDPRAGSWESYAGYPAALQAQLGTKVRLLLGALDNMAPTFSADGRICFRSNWWKVTYFDGRTWRKWGREEIKGDDHFVLDGPPFFNRAGSLAVNIEEQNWEFTEERGWHRAGYETGWGLYVSRGRAPTSLPPTNCAASGADSVVRDPQGLFWLTWRGQLYKGIPGLCLPQFTRNEHQPFSDSRKLRQAFTDKRGNIFFLTARNSGVEEYVFLRSLSSAPRTSLRVARQGEDSIQLEFSTNARGDSWFLWRLDEGPWSEPFRERTVHIEGLPNGKHTIQAAALDSRLQVDPTPVETAIEIRVDPNKQVAALIATLTAADNSRREAAIRALKLQPDLALPALRAARETVQGDPRWWIEAAIQEIERATRVATKQ